MDLDARRPAPHAVALVLFGVVAVLFAGGTSPAMVLTPAGLRHAALAVEVQDGMLPPGHPGHLGAAVPVGWGWHLVVGVIAERLGVPVHVIGVLFAAAAVGGLLAFCWVVTGLVTRRPEVRLAFSLLPFFLAAPSIPVVAIAAALGAPIHDPPPGLFGWFLPLGPAPFGIALAGSALITFGRTKWSTRLRMLAGFLIGGLATLVWPPAGLAVLLCAVGALLGTLSEPIRWSRRLGPMLPSLGYAAGVLACIPVLYGVIGEQFRPSTLAEALRQLWAIVPVLPLVGTALSGYRGLSRPIRQLFWMSVNLGLASVAIHRGDGAHYLYSSLMGVTTALMLLALLDERTPEWRTLTGPGAQFRWRVTLLTGSLGALALLASLGLAWGQSSGTWTRDGTALVASPQPPQLDAARWIRRNTPTAAYLLADPTRGYATSLATERRIVADADLWAMPDSHPLLVERVSRVVTGLTACDLAQVDLVRLAAVPVPWPASLYAVVDGKPCATLPGGVARVYDNAAATVYVLRLPL